MSARQKLAPRREGITIPLRFRQGATHGGAELLDGELVSFDATFCWDSQWIVREVFASPFKLGSDQRAMMRQWCIDRSYGLQHGASFIGLVHALGEDDPSIPPRSIFGAVVRAGAAVETEMAALSAVTLICPQAWVRLP